MRLVTILLCCISIVAFGQEPAPRTLESLLEPPKVSVPEARAIEEAETLVQEVFKADFDKARTAPQKIAVAKQLLERAAETSNDPAGRFVLLRHSASLAAAGGDVDGVSQAFSELKKAFKIEVVPLWIAALETVSKQLRTAGQRQSVAEIALKVIEEALAGDDFESATKLGQIATVSARGSQDAGLIREVASRVKSLKDIEKQFAIVAESKKVLEANPTDPEANLAVGRYHCFVKGGWDTGLAMFVLSKDTELKRVAELDLSNPATAEGQVAAGDAWWNLATNAKAPEAAGMRLRAAHWYRSASPSLAGLAKAKVAKRLEEVSGPESKFVSLFDGKQLSEWDLDSSLYSISNGLLTCKVPGAAKSGTWMTSKKRYQSFVLRVNMKLLAGEHGTSISFGDGYSVHIPNATSGVQLYQGKDVIVDVDARLKERVAASTKGRPFNTYTLAVNGPDVVVEINGIKTLEYESKTPFQASGLGIQLRVGASLAIQSVEISEQAHMVAQPDRTVPESGAPALVRPTPKKAEFLSPHQILPLVEQVHLRTSAWQRKQDGLYNAGSDRDLFHIPVSPAGAYDLEAKVTRLDDSKSYICFIVPFGEKGLWLIYDWDRSRSGVDNVGKYTQKANVLPPGEEKTLTMKIRADGAKAFVDGEELFSWAGVPKDAFNQLPVYAAKPAIQVLTIDKSQWKISSIELRPSKD